MIVPDMVLTVRPGPSIEWLPGVPPEVRAGVEPILLRWLPRVAPSWLHRVIVKWDHWSDQAAARCSATPEYRSMNLTICPQWLTEEPATRERHLIHELVHVPLEPLRDAFFAATESLSDDTKKAYEEQLRLATEGAVCDLTDILLRQWGPQVQNDSVFAGGAKCP